MELPKIILVIAIIVLALCKRNHHSPTSCLIKKTKLLSKKEFYRRVLMKRKINRNVFNANRHVHLMLLLILSGDIEINPGPVHQDRYVAKPKSCFYCFSYN